jgi:hypothetical protein
MSKASTNAGRIFADKVRSDLPAAVLSRKGRGGKMTTGGGARDLGPEVRETESAVPRAMGASGLGHDVGRISVHAPGAAVIQPKLTINEPHDESEREADRFSAQVVRTSGSTIEPALSEGLWGRGQNDRSASSQVQRRAEGGTAAGAAVAPAVVHDALRTSGRPLDRPTRALMEPRFGHDFGNVSVHTDARAAESARAVGALAYTVGSHVVFGEGRFDPRSTGGQRLLAHELTHVVQQSRSAKPMVQRDTPAGQTQTPAKPPVPDDKSPERKAAMAEVAKIEANWRIVKKISAGFPETAGWITKGGQVVALVREHTNKSLDAIAAGDHELAADFGLFVQGDLVAYRYITWHAFVYQNLARLRPSLDSLVTSFDADDRAFTGRAAAEAEVRLLKRLIDSLPRDSAATLGQVITNRAYVIHAARGNAATTVTSAADKDLRAALKKETWKIKDLQIQVQIIIEDVNKFMWSATKQGFKQAIEAVKEFYEVRQGILDDENSDPDADESKKSDDPNQKPVDDKSDHKEPEGQQKKDPDPAPPERTGGSGGGRPDLYRGGNASNPRMDNVRVPKDATLDDQNNVVPMTKGVSTFEKPSNEKNWWEFPASASPPARIHIENDSPGHWGWQPKVKMTLDEFKEQLRSSHASFKKIS